VRDLGAWVFVCRAGRVEHKVRSYSSLAWRLRQRVIAVLGERTLCARPQRMGVSLTQARVAHR